MRQCAVLVLIVLLASCESRPVVKADSTAPVVVVGETWTVDSLEQLRIAGITTIDSLEPIGDVKGLARLPDGRVVVGDGRISALEFFNAEGEYTRTVGEKGSGKDGISRLARLMHCGDSLYVEDTPERHYKVFTINGVRRRTFPLPADSAGNIATTTSCNSHGTAINFSSTATELAPNQSQSVRAPVSFWLSNAAGKTLHSLGVHAGREQWFARSGSGGEFSDLPMGRETFIAISNQRAYIGTADSFAIDVYTLNGVRAGTLRKPIRGEPITPSDIARYKQRDTSGLALSEIATRVSHWSNVVFPTTSPAYTALVVDSADNLWVRAQPPKTNDWVQWFVFAPDGTEVAHALMPQSLHVVEIGSDWVLGVGVNEETGRPMVKAFGLHRGPL